MKKIFGSALCLLLFSSALLSAGTAWPKLRLRAIRELRSGFSQDEFWPSMHAAEGLTAAGFGSSVAYDLRPRLETETDDQRRCGLSREMIRGGSLLPLSGMVKILEDPETSAPIHVCESLFKVGKVGNEAAMRRHRESPDTVEALMAAAALAKMGDAGELQWIRDHLAATFDEKTRRIAAWILGQIGEASDCRAIRPLAEKGTDPLAVAFAWNAMAKLGDREAQKKVLENLGSTEDSTRTYAAQTVGVFGAPAQLSTIAELLRDKTLDTRIRAAEAIVKITNRMLAKDSDGDSIPDAVEKMLGTPVADAEILVPFHSAKPRSLGSADPETLPADFTAGWFAHVGGQRYLWVFEFSEAVSEQRTIFHPYLRLDNDEQTGRQDGHQGVDAMYSFVDAESDPRIFTKSLHPFADRPVRGVVVGNRYYLCDDVNVAVENGKTVVHIKTLSERYPNSRTKKKTGWTTPSRLLSIALRAERSLPELPYPRTEGFIKLEPNYTTRYNLRYAKTTVLLALEAGESKGFLRHFDGGIEYREGKARLDLRIPVGGSYRLVFHARSLGGGPAGLSLGLNGKPIGKVAVASGSRPGTLFYSPVLRFSEGDVLWLEANEDGGRGKYNDFMLCQETPVLPKQSIDNVQTVVLPAAPGESGDRVEVVWTTPWSATCSLQIGDAVYKTVEESGVNHRVDLPAEFIGTSQQGVICIESSEDFPGLKKNIAVEPKFPTPPASAHQFRKLPLSVVENCDMGRTAWPLTSGVPFAQGDLAPDSPCRLLTAEGGEIPSQFRPLSLWPDGSVRWLLIDALVATKPQKATSLILELNGAKSAVPAPRILAAKADDSGVSINTGSLRIDLARDVFAPFAKLVVDGRDRSIPGAFVATDSSGKRFTSAGISPDEMVLEEAGPVRATVRIRGAFADEAGKTWMRYLCRLHAYAGQSWVKMDFSFENNEAKPQMSLVQSLALKLDAGCERERRLFQDKDNRYFVDAVETPGRADGVMQVNSRHGSLTVAVRDFWQLYPKAIETHADGSLDLALLPRLSEKLYDSDEDRKLEDRLYFWYDQGNYKLRHGMRFSTEFAVDFGGGKAGRFNAAVQQPLFASATPAHYCASGIFGNLVPRNPENFVRYENNVDKAFADFMKRREDVREFGFMNFGDWYGERKWNWGNVEYDTHFALALHFMRTGVLPALLRAEEAASHNADVDTTHYSQRKSDVGRVWAHSSGHTGGYYPREFRNMGGFNTGGRGAGHTWARGHFLLWGLTGNERYHEAGKKIAHYQAGVLPRSPGIGTNRDGGWTLIGALGAYQVSGDPYYLNGARILVERILDKQKKNGQWGHRIWECRDQDPVPWGCKPFMTGVILHSLAMFDRVAPSPRVQDAIRRGADYLWRKTYVPQDHGFIYAEAPRFQGRGGIWTLTLNGDGLSRAINYDPEQKDRALLLDALSHTMYRGNVSSFGKSFTQGLCFMPFMLAELTAMKVKNPDPVVEPILLKLRSQVILPPGESMIIRPLVTHNRDKAVDCRLEFPPASREFVASPPPWKASGGSSLGPEIRVSVPQASVRRTFTYKIVLGETEETRQITFEAYRGEKRGENVGWITSGNDPLAKAALAGGVEIRKLDELNEKTLGECGTLVVGSEAFFKNSGGCCAHGAALSRFVISGGCLLVAQLNDSKWKPDFLPLDLFPDNASTLAGKVENGKHPLFAGIKAEQLKGVMSYDHIAWAAPRWQVLMVDEKGRPAILEANLGKGRIVQVQPSFDREVPASPAASLLIRNLLNLRSK